MSKEETIKNLFITVSLQMDDELKRLLKEKEDCEIRIDAVHEGKSKINLIVSKV